MSESKCLYIGGESEIVIKKSRFITNLEPVETQEKAIEYIEGLKKKYWNATHNCSAFIIGEDMKLQRYSDDGEPQGTAGRPMLEVLLANNIHNAVAVVTRYFGGTLLGAGGLVRAYSQAVSEAVSSAVIISKLSGIEVSLKMDYNEFGKVEHYLAERKLPKGNISYTDSVSLSLFVTDEEEEDLRKRLSDLTNGKIEISKIREIKFARNDGKNILL